MQRAREFDRKNDPTGMKRSWGGSKRRLPNRDQYVMVGEKLGVPREVSEREYDAWEKSRNGRHA